MPEYALLLIAVLLMAGAAMKGLGGAVDARATQAAELLRTSGSAGEGLFGLSAGAAGAKKSGWLGALGSFAKDFVKGFVEGDFAEGSSWGQTIGQIAGGFVPVYGQIADIRDLAADAKNVYQGKPGAWKDLALSAVAVVPGIGDAAKEIFKGGERAAKAVKDAGKIGEGAEKAAKGAEEIAREGSKVEKGAAAGAVAGTVRRSAEDINKAIRKAETWADENWDEIKKLPPANEPGLSYHGFSSEHTEGILDNGVLSGQALGKPPGANSDAVWLKQGQPFYLEGPQVVVPTDRVKALGGFESSGLAGQKGVIKIPYDVRPGGIPPEDVAIVVSAGNGYVIPVHVPPNWSGPPLPIAPGWKP